MYVIFVVYQVTLTHCFQHWHALASKTLVAILQEVLFSGTNLVNLIRTRALNPCFVKKIEAKYEVLSTTQKFSCSSRGQILKPLIEFQVVVSLCQRKENLLLEHFDLRGAL